MGDVLWIALGGALGASLRYLLGGLVGRSVRADLPLGTLAVNLLGCFLIGAVWAAGRRYANLGRAATVVLVGFMGGLTTFSSLVFDASQLFTSHHWLVGLGDVVVQLILGLAGLYVGIHLVQKLA